MTKKALIALAFPIIGVIAGVGFVVAFVLVHGRLR